MPISYPPATGVALAVATSNAGNTGISTTYVDITDLTITFTVSDQPVLVRAHLPYVQPSASMTVIAAIRDEANTELRTSAAGANGATFTSPIEVLELITTPGTYTRKVSVKRFGGSGTIAVGTAGSPYHAMLSATTQ